MWGDSAYSRLTAKMKAKVTLARNLTHNRGASGRPLAASERARNRAKSRVCAKVEHQFATPKGRSVQKGALQGLARSRTVRV